MLIRVSKCSTGTMVQRLRQDWEAERASDPGCKPKSSSLCIDRVNPQEWVTQLSAPSPTCNSSSPLGQAHSSISQKTRPAFQNSLSQRWCFQIVFLVGFSQPVCTSGTGNAPWEWATQLLSHVVKNLLSLISTYHPSGSNPTRCAQQSVFKMWREKKRISMLT